MKLFKSIILTGLLTVSTTIVMAAGTDTASGPVTGTVAETMESGGYTYMRLEEQGIWIATAAMPVSAGDLIQYFGGMEMRNFHSRSLDRTFESVWFIQNVSLAGQDAGATQQAAMQARQPGAGAGHMQIPEPVSVQAPAEGDIAVLQGGTTVAGIFATAAHLKEQSIGLRARVIKVSKNIKGKNWITLQDGTGTAPDNRLMATSTELVSPGDLVIATGIVRTDIDIGAGYKYKVLLEEATFSPGTG